MTRISLSIPTSFRPYVEPVCVRLGYLRPNVELTCDKDLSEVTARFDDSELSATELKKEIWFHLYREKIYQDTLPIRIRLYGGA